MSASVLAIYMAAVLAISALFSYIVSFSTRRWAILFRALDYPKKERKIHREPIPLWGGLGIAMTLCVGAFALGIEGGLFHAKLLPLQLLGFIAGVLILNIGGMLDDRFDIKPWQAILFPVIAALIVIATGTTIGHVTNPATSSALFLDWWTWQSPVQAIKVVFPGDILTFVWLMVAIYATKITDGLDGLVAGITVIGATMVGALSALPTFYQPASAVLASLVAGSFLGFLPRNVHPAKQFLGEGGSTIAGFCLGFLAIVSSAKIAIALAVLAIPVADVMIVALRRIFSGRSPFAGDSTHLHFRLLAAGIPHRTIVGLLWSVSAAAGLAALLLQTRGKIFLVIMLAVMTFLGSWFADKKIRQRLPTVDRKDKS